MTIDIHWVDAKQELPKEMVYIYFMVSSGMIETGTFAAGRFYDDEWIAYHDVVQWAYAIDLKGQLAHGIATT